MSDTGQIPGEGLPENAGLVEQPGIAAPDAYPYLAPSEHVSEDDDLLLMPSPQGAWSDPQTVPAPGPYPEGVPAQAVLPEQGTYQAPPAYAPPTGEATAQPQEPGQTQVPGTHTVQQTEARPEAVQGTHESGGRDSGSVDLGGVRIPSPTPAAQPQAPVRRPLHRGPVASDGPTYGGASTGGVVRSLADRGPAGVPAAPVQQAPVRQPVPQATGPEYFGTPGDGAAVLPGPQLGEILPQGGIPWAADVPQPVAPSATVETAVPEPVAEPVPAPAAPTEPEQTVQAAVPEAVYAPEAVDDGAPIAVGTPAEVPAEPVAEATPVAAAESEAPAAEEATETAPSGQFVSADDPAPTAALQDPAPAAEPVAEPEPEPQREAFAGEPVQPAEPGAAEQMAAAVTGIAPEQAPEPVPAPAEGVEPVPAPAEAPDPAPVPGAEDEAATVAGPGPQVIEAPEATGSDRSTAAAPMEPGQPEDQDPHHADGDELLQTSESDGAEVSAPAPGYDDAEREAVLRVMRERRDIRNGFRSDPIPHEVLLRVLEAAHTAPSVGHSQPWDFVVIRSAETRRTMHELAQRQREAYAQSLPKSRAKQFKELKIEAILETPVNIVVTADPTRGGRHTLGRYTQPQMAPYSSALAVENLWLAARAEGLGVGWVSFFDEREMVRTLGLPEHLEVVAYLCVGYVDEFPEEPELMQAGWSKRRPLSWVVHEETYGRRALPGEEPHDLLQETVAGIRPLDAKALGEAWERQKRMTKPAGALGMLEIISAQLSGLSRMCPPPIPEPAAVAVFAGDHGVHAQGVTAWPQEVTGQMVANFLDGGAVCNAFAAQVGAEVCVVDVGVAMELPARAGLLPRKVRAGTADFTTGPALTREEVLAAIEVGIETARDLVAAGNKALLIGEMGIANTTASAALICVYTGMDPAEVTGRGTGINDEMHARKVDVVRRALELHQPDPADPIGVLAAVGGLEHAAMAGFLLGGASLRTPVILDGVSTGAAALVARAIAPEALAACIAGHRSAEPGHVAALNKLGLRPLVDLDLRLGEGTGALLALPIVQSAARAMHEVATFDSAGVTEK
ncbi:nicotinate-nucleotide--dimethylbenzimidazole phosphoribosyltransferase [Streptomyces sp. NPDC052052]|uniref:nicotinate-nucleotide--dimethylbenzimidazole phosphoribosyltransferase n=1 Tax=Streptomyces sp. NPDC052052 TaxID=3154756 RepID=UPI00342631B8